MYPTLQSVLDDWDHAALVLEGVALSLAHDAVPHARFHERAAAAPLPRAFQWADGSAYVNHVELVRRARGAELPASFWQDPLMYQGGSDQFLCPREPIAFHDPVWGLDLEAEVVVVPGLSGAGKSTVLRALTDIGYFCVDNLPPSLVGNTVSTCVGGGIDRIALGTLPVMVTAAVGPPYTQA